MLSTKRYDPSATDIPNETAVVEDTAGLQAIKDRIKRNKAKRDKTVQFSQVTESAAVAPVEAINEEPKGILKEPATSTSQGQPKAKTKAKQKYLKRKLDRKKAVKKQAVLGEPAVNRQKDGEVVDETPEQRAERKKALKAARRQQKAEATLVPASDVTESSVQAPAEATTQEQTSDEPPKKKRKKTKALEEAAVSTEDTPIVSAKDQKALDKAAKATARAARLASKLPPRESEQAVPPTHPNALPRFPRPVRLVAPDKSLLAQLSIAEELQGGLRVNPSVTVKIDDLVESTSKDGPKHLLSERARGKLAELDMTEFFAVQSVALPLLLDTRAQITRVKGMQPRDLCFNAPTGSGKTLAYVLPVVELLAQRVIRRLRALIVLPTRDLVMQVKETFDTFCKGTDLKIGVACGQHTYAKEQEMLSGTMGRCGVDILIATPGRLCDHIAASEDSKLFEHLQYLVIDEADRLLDTSFNEWLPILLAHLKEAQDFSHQHLHSAIPLMPRPTAQKLLFSATLSRDPKQISRLHLYSPLYIAVTTESADVVGDSADFSLPPTLKEHMIVGSSSIKPLLLVHLLRKHNISHGLCFTKSLDSSARLVKLVEFMEEEETAEESRLVVRSFSSDLPVQERGKLLAAFQEGKVHLLVCSDLIARGMDISHVTNVINYDIPVDMRKYVHRVGRTARAGRDGDAWSLVESQEAAYFKNLLKGSGRLDKVDQIRVKSKELDSLMQGYERALEKLKDAFTRS